MVKLFYAIGLILIIVASSLVSVLKKSSEEVNHNVRKQCQNVSLLFFLLGALELMAYEYLELGVMSNKIKVTKGFLNFIHTYGNALDICLLVCLFMFVLGTFLSFYFNNKLAKLYASQSIRLFFWILDFFIIFYLVAGIVGLLN